MPDESVKRRALLELRDRHPREYDEIVHALSQPKPGPGQLRLDPSPQSAPCPDDPDGLHHVGCSCG